MFAFLNQYFAGDADFNGDGETSSADLTEFVACFTGPPEECGR